MVRRVASAAFALASLVACGGSEPRARSPSRALEPPTSPQPASAAEPGPICADAHDCLERAAAALHADDESARRLFDRACELGEQNGCASLGMLYVMGKLGPADPEKAREAFGKSCGPPVYIPDACAWFVHMTRARGVETASAAETNAAKVGCEVGGRPSGRKVRGEACLAYGQTRERAQDSTGARRAYHDGCELGNDEACAAMKTVPDSARVADATKGPEDVPGANLSMASMDVDGLTLKDIACRTEGGGIGGLFGGIALGAGFKAKKAQLDACSPNAAKETRVRWTGVSGRMTKVEASGPDAKTNKCVERALTNAVATTSGLCAATVVHGKKK